MGTPRLKIVNAALRAGPKLARHREREGEEGEEGGGGGEGGAVWTCTTWESMNSHQQSRMRYLQKMSSRHGLEYPPLMRALDSTALRSGWTNDQLTAALRQMNGTGTKEDTGTSSQQRCSVS